MVKQALEALEALEAPGEWAALVELKVEWAAPREWAARAVAAECKITISREMAESCQVHEMVDESIRRGYTSKA